MHLSTGISQRRALFLLSPSIHLNPKAQKVSKKLVEEKKSPKQELTQWYGLRKIHRYFNQQTLDDLKLLRYRNFITKRSIFRRPIKDPFPEYAEVGTVVDDTVDSSSRPPRHRTLFDAWMHDTQLRHIAMKRASRKRPVILKGSDALSRTKHAHLPPEKRKTLYARDYTTSGTERKKRGRNHRMHRKRPSATKFKRSYKKT